MTNEEALRAKAEASCRAAEGDDWDQMFSGEQECRIEAWLDGYKAAVNDVFGRRIELLNEAISKLRTIQQDEDTERAHQEADDVLCDTLESLGYSDIVAEYKLVDRWFA